MGGGGFEEALAAARVDVEETGATFIHAFEDRARDRRPRARSASSSPSRCPTSSTVVIPVGGGGLAVRDRARAARPAPAGGSTSSACTGRDTAGYTIADGIAVKHPGELTTPILDERLDELVDVDDEEISEAIVLLLERAKLVVEGAGAASASRRSWPARSAGRARSRSLLSGGNIDPTLLISVMRHGLTLGGRYLVMRTRISDRPGELVKLLSLVAEERATSSRSSTTAEGMDVPVAETEVELTLITRDQEHCTCCSTTMRSWGYPVERIK